MKSKKHQSPTEQWCMMSFGKTRGGTRGGADQFKWEDVKNDKYRENYLGHSVQAPVGRWQKGKDLNWYNKLSQADRTAALKSEIALAKERDQELMDQALGIAPKRRTEPTGQLEAAEVKELLQRGVSEREGLDAERVEGVGAAPLPARIDTGPKKTMAEKYAARVAAGLPEDDIYALGGNATGTATATAQTSRGDDDTGRSDTDERTRRKAAKKALKKEKKRVKKEKKREKKRSHHAPDDHEIHESRHDGERRDTKRGREHDNGRRVSSRSRSRDRSHGRGRGRAHEPPTDERRRIASAEQEHSREHRRTTRSHSHSHSRSRSPDGYRSRRRRRSRSPSYRARQSRRRSYSRSRSRSRSYSRRR